MPAGLIANKTNLKELGKDFKSHYKLIVGEISLLGFMRITNFPTYLPVDPNIIDPRPQIRTQFDLDYNQSKTFAEAKSLVLVSTVGHFLIATREGYDFDAGKKVNSEEAQVERFQSIHEGPISYCGIHTHLKDYVLTVGGRIFSMWNINSIYPLLWRKAKSGLKYITGGWLMRRPTCIMLIVSDGTIEVWDWSLNNNEPIRVIPTGGEMLLNLHGTVSSNHTRKNTFGLSDNLGTMTFYHLPSFFTTGTKDEVQIAEQLLTRCYKRMLILRQWIEKFEEEYQKTEEDTLKTKVESLLKATVANKERLSTVDEKGYFSQIEKMNRIFAGANWKSEEERQMFKTMLDRKKLNLKELEIYKDALQKQVQNRTEKLIKQDKIIANKTNIFVFETNKIFSRRTHLDQQRKFSLQASIDLTKQEYVEDYDLIEDASLYYINTHEFHYEFLWSKLMHAGHKVKKNMQDWFKSQRISKREMREKRQRKIYNTSGEPSVQEFKNVDFDESYTEVNG